MRLLYHGARLISSVCSFSVLGIKPPQPLKIYIHYIGSGAMNIAKTKNKHEALRLFCKSAMITALCVALMCALVGGILTADKNTKAASGSLGGFELRGVDDRTLSFELLGTIYSVDLNLIFSVVNELKNYVELLCPERRLEYLAVQGGLDALDRAFCQNE